MLIVTYDICFVFRVLLQFFKCLESLNQIEYVRHSHLVLSKKGRRDVQFAPQAKCAPVSNTGPMCCPALTLSISHNERNIHEPAACQTNAEVYVRARRCNISNQEDVCEGPAHLIDHAAYPDAVAWTSLISSWLAYFKCFIVVRIISWNVYQTYVTI